MDNYRKATSKRCGKGGWKNTCHCCCGPKRGGGTGSVDAKARLRRLHRRTSKLDLRKEI